jgi:hypothetical protein
MLAGLPGSGCHRSAENHTPHTHGGTDAPECTPYGTECRRDEPSEPAEGDTIDGYCGFCGEEGHKALNCTALSGTLASAANEAMRAQYEPTGLILHPIDHAVVRVHEVEAPTPEERVEAQKRIADAFGLPYWVAGVDGYRPPLRVRWHPRNVARRARTRTRRLIGRLPGVYDYGYVPRKDTWMYEGSTERRGRWWVQVGPFRVGTGWDEEDW